MKKIIFLSLIVLIVSFLGGCKKDPLDDLADDEARMHGKVLEKGSNKPVKGARVYLSVSHCEFLSGCSGKVIDSLTTDATGSYDFTYKHDNDFGGSFNIVVAVPQGYRKENSIIALAPNTNTIVSYDIVIQPLAWVKVHVKNVNPFDEFDKVWISGGWSGAAGDHQYYGKDLDFYLKKEINGNDSLGIGWYVTKNNIQFFKSKRLYVIGHDTTNFEILY